ncbi:MAG TPA: hypothetical protein VGR10_04530, partial [Thermoleophilaceae bacterium]|nr:hypothetical protein [Thermoleophilaceae bacterium]
MSRDWLDGTPEVDAPESRLGALRHPRRMAGLFLAVVLLVVAIYVLIPQLVGLDDALDRLGQAQWYWLVAAFAFTVAGFVAYIALLRGVLGGRSDDVVRRRLGFRATYEITLASLAATRLFSAAGAGGLALTYWALRRAGMPRRRAACRMVAFLALLYTVYLAALVVFGLLLRTGVLPGANPLGGTVIPAAIAGTVLVAIGLLALIPGDVERRLRRLSGGGRSRWLANLAARLASGPATVATGIRT